MTAKTTRTEPEEPAIEAIGRKLAAVTLELGKTRLELTDTQEDLESTQAELETVQSSLAETHLELQNTKAALTNSERARQTANRDRVLPRSHGKQEIFVVLKFQNPQELPIGGYCLFAVQRNAVNGAIKQFKTKNPELDAVEIEELRFDRSPRGENVYQQMKYDNAAPI
ncbi:hypothetical protein BGZ80_008819, partial [Entomortierella chlamydospora]